MLIRAVILGVVVLGLAGCGQPDTGTMSGSPEAVGTSVSALVTNCPSPSTQLTNLNIYNVCSGATAGAGTSTAPWTGWETALNAIPAGTGGSVGSTGGGTEIYFPAGYYTLATGITLKPGWTVRGAGMDASAITSTYTGDAFKLAFPANTTSWGDVRVEDLSLFDSTSDMSTTNAAIDVIDGAYVYLTRVLVTGFAYGVIFDGAEVSFIDECIFDQPRVAGVWLANGPDHGVTGQGYFFTNQIGIRRSQFNQAITNAIGVLDDGGTSHIIDGCNFELGNPAIRVACAPDATISNSEFEGSTGPTIVTSDTTYHSLTGCGGDSNLTISGNSIPSGSQHAISFNSGYEVVLSNNLFSSTVTAVVGVATVGELTSISNEQQTTAAMFDANPADFGMFATVNGLGVGTSTPSQVLEVNGGARLNTTTSQPGCSASTRGTFWVVQGGTGVKDEVQVCAKDAANAYAWRVIY
jgi:hypothetical protein